MIDWVRITAVVLAVVCLPFAVLFLAKLIGYGLESGRHKFHNRRKRKGDDGARKT